MWNVCVYRCWERNINMGYWWIIRSPILFAYLVRLSVRPSLVLIFSVWYFATEHVCCWVTDAKHTHILTHTHNSWHSPAVFWQMLLWIEKLVFERNVDQAVVRGKKKRIHFCCYEYFSQILDIHSRTSVTFRSLHGKTVDKVQFGAVKCSF